MLVRLVTICGALATGTAGADDRDARARAILEARCLACHDAEKHKGGLDLSRRESALTGGEGGPAIEPGDPGASLLVERIEAGEMPPEVPLEPAEIAALRDWVAGGAPYASDRPLVAAPRRAGPDWWSLQPIGRPEPPKVVRGDWVRNPIDAFILAGLEAKGLAPAPEADRRTLIRRLSFDLIGLPPSPEEIDAFLSDENPDAYERLVDRLLASPHYGERWGRHWLDVVRFAESHGYETNVLRENAWPYRDYVIRAFNDDVPLARFAAEQLAGDALPDADFLARTATGFLVGGAHDVVTNQTEEGALRQRADDLDDMIAATSVAFLGLSAQCARCHDHKFDPIAQRDYTAIAATFAGVRHAERAVDVPDAPERRQRAESATIEVAALERRIDDLETPADPSTDAPLRTAVVATRNVERFAPIVARFVRFTAMATGEGYEPCLDELEVYGPADPARNLAAAGVGGVSSASTTYAGSDLHKLEHLNDGRHGNGRSWISAEPGRGWAAVELPAPAAIDRVVWGRDREAKFADRLAIAYRIEVAAEPGDWQIVAGSNDRAPAGTPPAEPTPERAALAAQIAALRAAIAANGPTQMVYAGTFEPPGPTRRLERGDVLRPAEEVGPGAIAAVGPPLAIDPTAPESGRRLALARWIGDPANPLPPRVAANRAWQHHFGRGIVATPGDLGFQGARPTHPELLDWLGRAFLDAGGRLKPLHRLIVTSAAYRQSSRPDPAGLAADRDAAHLWRMPPRRLEAEAIRDAMLAVAGTLDRRAGGPGYTLWQKNTNYVVVFNLLDDPGPESRRRMVYQFRPRGQPDPTFAAFDCPDGALVAPRRNRSTTPQQALDLMHGRFVVARSAELADRLRREAGPDPAAQADRAFLLAFGRPPTPPERDGAIGLIRDHGAEALARALYNASEFIYVP